MFRCLVSFTALDLQLNCCLMCVCSETLWYATMSPIKDHLVAARCEPFAPRGWTLEVMYYDLKGIKAFLQNLSTEGRGVRLC